VEVNFLDAVYFDDLVAELNDYPLTVVIVGTRGVDDFVVPIRPYIETIEAGAAANHEPTALQVTVPEVPTMVVACHCRDCQRRTGSAFGVGAFYPADEITTAGEAEEFVRTADSGGKVRNHFCPNCGSTVYWRADRLPSMIAVAVGALADPVSPSPAKSIFEQSKRNWVQIAGAIEHFDRTMTKG
jgi:hypothetical protein